MTRHLLRLIWNRKRQNFLLTLEIFFSFLTLFGVVLFAMQYANNARQPLGFTIDRVWSVSVDRKEPSEDPAVAARHRETYRQLLTALREMPQIEVASAAFTGLAYVTGHAVFASYLALVRFPPTGEVTIFCGALVGASLGFLWFNSYPAEVFMGDVGSLGLGGALGTVAILIKQELLLPIVGGVWVLEALSVILQVGYFQATGGKRLFKMAPLHHHFEQLGWKEPKVITRFIILAICFALFSMATLKLR